MGKRSNFERNERDYYITPPEAVDPLLPYLNNERFCEPCAGNGALKDYLISKGHTCAAAWDIEPQAEGIDKLDATQRLIGNISCFITNPPWERSILHSLIKHLSSQHPTWLLFDADWLHTKQASEYWPHCKGIVSIGRVKWIKDSPYTGKDNCCWYLFDWNFRGFPTFVGR